VAQRTRDQEKAPFAHTEPLAGQRAWAPVGSPVATPPPPRLSRTLSCKSSPNPRRKKDTRRHADSGGARGRLYMIPSSNCSEALFLPLCLHSGASLSALARRFCRSISTPVPGKFTGRNRLYMISCSKSPGGRGLGPRPPRGRAKNPRPKHVEDNIATNPLLNGPQQPL